MRKLLLCLLILWMAACAPMPDAQDKAHHKTIQEYHSYERKSLKKHAFGDCDSRDLANFTCE